jgi:hypothetical protein
MVQEKAEVNVVIGRGTPWCNDPKVPGAVSTPKRVLCKYCTAGSTQHMLRLDLGL